MSFGLIYSASWDTTTKTLSFFDKAGNMIYSCVVDISPQPIVDDPTKPLYLLSKADGSTVYIRIPTGDSFEKSTDGTTWESWAGGTEGRVTLDTGDGLYIRAAAERTSYPTSDATTFRFFITGSVEAYHNVNSVLTPNFATLADLTTLTIGNGANCLRRIFKQCVGLTKAPLLPATVLSQGCYEGAFNGCIGLLQIPDLPFTTTAINSCSAMFYGCTSLTDCSSINLIADYVVGNTTYEWNGAYHQMFYGCTSLTKAPHIKATRLGANALRSMFYGCTSLNEIKIDAIDISSTNCLYQWTNNVSATGDFYCVNGVAYSVDSVSGIPTGWTRHDLT